MKAYDLCLYIILLTSVIGLVDSLGMFPTYLAVEDETARIQELTGFEPGGTITSYEENYSPGAMVISGLKILVGGLLSTVWIAPVLFGKLGMPALLVGVMQVGIWVIYFIGGIQLIFNRPIKQYE